MRVPVASASLAAFFILTPVAIGYAPALSQDFSITNPEAAPNAGRSDVLRQLQAWWDVHAYYPRHASNHNEDGTVKLHLVINPDGNISMADVVDGSGSDALDTAASFTFTGAYVRPFPAGAPGADIDIVLHYVLTHRHNQMSAAGYTPGLSKSPFTITNDPLKSPILDTMLQKTCTGTVVKQGIRNHPSYGERDWAQAIFFRRPDGKPWVKFYESGFPILAPVTEIGKVVQWTGREERLPRNVSRFTQYSVWPEGDNILSGSINIVYPTPSPEALQDLNRGGTVDFTCATETVPAVTWSAWSVTPGQSPPGDPP